MSVIAQQTNQMMNYPTSRMSRKKSKPIATKKQMITMAVLSTIILVSIHVVNYHLFPIN